MHIFTMLAVIGGLLVVVGMGSLLWLIPLLAEHFQKSEARTEFYSARAAYWCVLVGLGLFALLGVSAVLVVILKFAGEKCHFCQIV
jgi:hypothetical protein